MKRHILSDEQWESLRAVLPRARGRRAIRGGRLFINAVLWRARGIYRVRYLVEVFFHHRKRFRAIATRCEKAHSHFLALIHLACAWLWLR